MPIEIINKCYNICIKIDMKEVVCSIIANFQCKTLYKICLLKNEDRMRRKKKSFIYMLKYELSYKLLHYLMKYDSTLTKNKRLIIIA